jgi:hypothetical protein
MQTIFLILSFVFIQVYANEPTSKHEDITTLVEQLENYDSEADVNALVLGTFHFNNSVLSAENQDEISAFVGLLQAYKPTKILVEWEPNNAEQTNQNYQKFLNNQFSIKEKANEVYQLGFKLAKKMNHQQIYLFDDQTEYEGVLTSFLDENNEFSFNQFVQYAKDHDSGFYNKFEDILTKTFRQNEVLIKSLPLSKKIAVLNSPQYQHINGQRMQMFEVRVGIQKNWVGPDWLGRWYRRNIRMLGNILKYAEKGDRLLIIVGDNHKWLLDELIEKTPDFKLDSSWDLLKNMHQ